jgi:YgiT-type zinc finger domain-containing protein
MHTCTNCHIGTLQRKTGAYAAWHSDQFIVIPAAPLWICDVCGERTYDATLIDQLLPLIGLPLSMTDGASAGDVHHNADVQSSALNDRTRRRA